MFVMHWSWDAVQRTPMRVVRKAMDRIPVYARILAGAPQQRGAP